MEYFPKNHLKSRELFIIPRFLKPADELQVLGWLSSIKPLWENRYSIHNPPPAGEWQRQLKRPVYWLGNWQFACLDYYRPPHGVWNRCVRAEPYPDFVQSMVKRIESQVRRTMQVPEGWHLNTLLINYYGKSLKDGRSKDQASVGEHRDFEPGPVASLSFGESALFQFVRSRQKGTRDGVVWERWLEHGDLQAFGGEFWKTQVFHRVQRVKKKANHRFEVGVDAFEVRRINLTFRYVPVEHVMDFQKMSHAAREDISPYIEELALHSPFFKRLSAVCQPCVRKALEFPPSN